MAKYIAPTLTITSTTVSTAENYSLKVTDSLLVDAPIQTTSLVKAATGGVIIVPATSAGEDGTIAVDTWLYAQNKDSAIECTITNGTQVLAVIGPLEFCFFKVDSTVPSVKVVSASGTPEVEYSYWTKG